MSKIELTLASNYVPSWTVVDAIRELFQNALDQEAQSPTNAMAWDYNADSETLTISNKESVLTTKSLLLGETSKANSTDTIGQFGEGYKVAALVLLRNNKELTFYNYGVREVWSPRFVKSRRFGADILTFFIDKKYPWTSIPDNDLTITIQGITNEEWTEHIVPSNLHLQDAYVVEPVPNEYAEILTEDKYKGKVFVNGLFVCHYENYNFGYNFKPGQLKLDRDRKLVSNFDLNWLASKAWANRPRVSDIIAKGYNDVEYIQNFSYGTKEGLADELYNKFRVDYGSKAVPVTSQTDADAVPPGYKPVIVSSNYKHFITRSISYQEPIASPDTTTLSPLERLRKWYESIRSDLGYNDEVKFEDIYEDLELELLDMSSKIMQYENDELNGVDEDD